MEPAANDSITDALAHIAQLWPRLIRSIPQDAGTLIGMPRPFAVPRPSETGAGMFQEMYYWDSYFISLGLIGTPHERVVADIAENFAYLVERFGMIPNGTRFYFLSRSQPPFFTRQINLVRTSTSLPEAGDNTWLARMLALAEREHTAVWLGTEPPHHRRVYRGLSRYFDVNYLDVLAACESGWDHTTRCDGIWLNHLPIDLNSILYARERDMSEFAEVLGDSARAARWRAAAEDRRAAMQELMWDGREGFFFDYNFHARRIHPQPSLAGFYPLWAGLATESQAAQAVERWLPHFLQPGGLVTTLVMETGKQWAWPNGWAPLQWIVASGLDRYGYHDQARAVRRRWCDTCAREFQRTGAFWEKYNVVEAAHHAEEGLYGQLQGFGWTNGVFVDFCRQQGWA